MTQNNPPPRSDRPQTTPATDSDHTDRDHATAVGEQGATAVSRTNKQEHLTHDYTTRDTFIGTDEHPSRASNVSWGAIFAGVVIFIALVFVFGLVSLGLGLEEAGGMAVGISSAIALIVALAIAGFVAGVLSIRAGFLHGLATWATSLVAILLLAGWLGASVVGALGGAIGTIAQGAMENTQITTEDLGAAAEEADVDQQDVDQAQQDVEDTAQDAQDNLAASAWWSVAGLLIGAVLAAFAGAAGSRSVHTRTQRDRAVTQKR